MLLYAYYSRLFSKLNIPNENNTYKTIIDNNYEFYKEYAKNNDIQTGGVKKKPKIENIDYNGYTFKIFIDKQSDNTTYSIFNGNDDESINKCMLLAIPKKKNYIHIDLIEYHTKCSIPDMPKSRGGTLLLQFALNYCRILKDEYPNLIYIHLRDTSRVDCTVGDKYYLGKTQLCNLYMFTKGDTWYGKYGFIPFDIINEKTDLKMLENYRYNQLIIKSTKINDTNIKKYLYNAVDKLKMGEDLTKSMIDKILEKFKGESVKTFFKVFISNRTCHIFNEIQNNIMNELKMTNFYGKNFYILINDIKLE